MPLSFDITKPAFVNTNSHKKKPFYAFIVTLTLLNFLFVILSTWKERFMKLESIALHEGYSPEATTKAAAVPIYQTTSFTFDDTQHGADLFNQ